MKKKGMDKFKCPFFHLTQISHFWSGRIILEENVEGRLDQAGFSYVPSKS